MSVLVFASTAFAQQQVRVPEGVNCPPNKPRVCLSNLAAAYDELFEETVAYKEVNAVNEVVNSQITTCEANLADTNAILEEVVAERSSIQAELSNLRARLSSSEMDLASHGSGTEMTTLYATIEQLRSENSTLSGQLQLAQQQLVALSSISAQSSYSYETTSSSSQAVVTARVEEVTRELVQLRLQLDALLLENQALKAHVAQPVVQYVAAEPVVQYVTAEPEIQVQVQTVYPDDYYVLQAENERLRQALSHQAPMHTAPAPVMPAPAPEK